METCRRPVLVAIKRDEITQVRFRNNHQAVQKAGITAVVIKRLVAILLPFDKAIGPAAQAGVMTDLRRLHQGNSFLAPAPARHQLGPR